MVGSMVSKVSQGMAWMVELAQIGCFNQGISSRFHLDSIQYHFLMLAGPRLRAYRMTGAQAVTAGWQEDGTLFLVAHTLFIWPQVPHFTRWLAFMNPEWTLSIIFKDRLGIGMVLLPPHCVGQSSHRPAYILVEGKLTLPTNENGVKEFEAI